MMAIIRRAEPVSASVPGFKPGGDKTPLLDFTDMVEILLRSGLSVKDSLEMVGASSVKSGAAGLSRHLLKGINRGLSIADAINALDAIFPPLYRSMVKFGDMVGSVEQIFSRLSVYLREQKKIREKIISAMIYPAMALILAVAGASALIMFVLPKLEFLFGAFTLNTANGAGELIKRNIFIMKILLVLFLAIMLLIALFFPVLKKLRRGKTDAAVPLDWGLLKIPLLGDFLLSWEMLNFSFAMEILTGGGIPVEAALYESAKLLSNSALKQGAFNIWNKVRNGGGIAKNFADDPLFPEYFSQWIAIGEQAKGIEKIFSQIRLYYQEEIERKTSRLIQLIEPCMITITGLIITAIAVGLIIPIFSIFGNLI